jgi:glycosyltransferase involved in cell wall biosynthesis
MWQEAVRIDSTIAQLAGSPLTQHDIELLFVDDGSTDGTAEQCEKALALHDVDARVLRLPVNRGKGAAVRHGMLLAVGEVIGFSDADLSCGPADIVAVFSAVERGDAPVAIASRTDSGTTIAERQPLARRMSGLMFNAELRVLGLTDLHDTQCGLKAFSGPVVNKLFEPLRTQRFAFDVEVLMRAKRAGLTVAEIPVTWRHVEASRVDPIRDGVRMAVDAAQLRWVLRGSSRSRR